MIEKVIVVVAIFINHFGTPESWFVVNTGSASGPDAKPMLVFGTLGLVGMLALGLVGNGEAVFRVILVEPLLAGFLILLSLSVLWSNYVAASVTGIVNVLLMVLLAIVLLVRYRLDEIIKLSAVAMGIGVLLDLLWIVGMGDYGSKNGIWDGLGTQKNELGGHSLIALLVLLWAAKAAPRFRFISYSLAICTTVLLVGSQSKTALAAGALSAACMAVFVVFRSRKTLFGAVLISISSASVVAVLFVTANVGLIAGWLDRDITLSGRTQLWGLVRDGIANKPWFGYGYDGFFQGPFSPAHAIVSQAEWAPTHAHNAYMEMALHVGVVGAVVYIGFTIRGIVRATDCARKVPGALGLFPLVYLTMATMISFTESGVFSQRFGLVLFFVALIVAKTEPDRLAGIAAENGVLPSSEASDADEANDEIDLRDAPLPFTDLGTAVGADGRR